MIISECPSCKKETLVIYRDSKSCFNEDCKDIDWSFNFEEELKSYLINRLGFCGCGKDHNCLPFIKEFLSILNLKRSGKDYDKCMNQLRCLITTQWDDVAWILAYVLDDKRILTHGGCVINGWIEDENFYSLLERYCSEFVKDDNDHQ